MIFIISVFSKYHHENPEDMSQKAILDMVKTLQTPLPSFEKSLRSYIIKLVDSREWMWG